jgi:hypothetical protein
LGATLPAEQALACWTALDDHARGRRADGDDRAIAEIMCDTLVERVTGAARADRAADVELQVVITDRSLLGSTDQPASLVGYGPIPAQTATRIAAETQAWVRRLLTDPVTGAVQTADAKRRRFFSGAARDLVLIRDRRCRNPVCNAPIRDIDHRIEHSAGGDTHPDNADAYCQRCHHLKDHPEMTVIRRPEPPALPDAHRIAWIGPTGHTYRPLPHQRSATELSPRSTQGTKPTPRTRRSVGLAQCGSIAGLPSTVPAHAVRRVRACRL